MAGQPDSSQDSGIFECPGSMDIAVIKNMAESLYNCMTQHNIIRIDGSQVERIDTAGLQLLTKIFAEGNVQDRRIEWNGYSETLYRGAELLGLLENLHLPLKRL